MTRQKFNNKHTQRFVVCLHSNNQMNPFINPFKSLLFVIVLVQTLITPLSAQVQSGPPGQNMPEFNNFTGRDGSFQPHCLGEEPLHFKMCEPGQTTLFKRTDNIVIIGAGAAGMTMSLMLKRRGFENVHILEKTGRVGGYAETVYYGDGTVPHEAATCYTIGHYECALRLMNEYYIGRRSYPDTSQVSAGPNDLTISQFWYGVTSNYPGLNIQNPSDFANQVYVAYLHYIDVYTHAVGKGTFTHPPELDANQLKSINMTTSEFLDVNDLAILKPYIYFAMTQQGYGFMDSTPAYYLLHWITPTHILSALRSLLNIKPSVTGSDASMLIEGYGNFMERISKGLNISRNIDIQSIERPESGGAIIRYTRSSGTFVEQEADFLIVTPRMPEFLSFMDARQDELDVFTKLVAKELTLAHVSVNGLQTHYGLDYIITSIETWTPNRIMMIRNDVNMIHEDLQPKLGQEDIRSVLLETDPNTPDEILHKNIMDQLTDLGGYNMTILRVGRYPYHSHFKQQDIQKGYVWKLDNLQGKYDTWYTGSYASFESVADIIDYNFLLFDTFLCNDTSSSTSSSSLSDNDDLDCETTVSIVVPVVAVLFIVGLVFVRMYSLWESRNEQRSYLRVSS